LQVHMLRTRKRCWLQRWCAVFRRLLPASTVHEDLAAREPIDVASVLLDMCDWYRQVLTRFGNPWSLDEVEHRKIAFTWHMVSCQHSWGKVPRVVSVSLSDPLRTCWLRFLAANSMVPARHYKVIRAHPEYRDRVCSKCSLHEVADERHILLYCPATADVRTRFRSVLRIAGSLQNLIHNNKRAWDALAEFVHECWRSYGWLPPV
jgi:hypothetical protein